MGSSISNSLGISLSSAKVLSQRIDSGKMLKSMRNIGLKSLQILYKIVLRLKIVTIIGNNFCTQYKHIQNLQTLHGYIKAMYTLEPNFIILLISFCLAVVIDVSLD